MIAHLEGTVVYKGESYVVVSVHGVGYKVFTSSACLLSFEEQDSCALFIYSAIRENAFDLYGFSTMEELGFFELLLGVSGIGPKSALAIFAVAPLPTLRSAIARGDLSYLHKGAGIGKKTAEKVILELRDKLKMHATHDAHSQEYREESDALEGLLSLGYKEHEARTALKEIPPEVEGASARIKAALGVLGKK
jgi:holliday junction DNA helicase RuvA